MKTFSLLLVSLLFSLPNAKAQTAAGCFTLQSGAAVITIDAAHGGKVTSLTLGGKELLAQHRKPEGMPFENMNDFGSTFWPSPQSEWNWPPIATYDSKAYEVVKSSAETLLLRSGKDAKYPYVFEKAFRTLGDGRYSITYTIKNEGAVAVKVAPWEITRVPSGGEISFEASEVRPADVIAFTQEGGVVRIPFTPERKNRKIFADAKGWLSFKDNGLVFTKRFPDIAHEQAAPGEEEVKIYWNFGTTYTEIENQGEYVCIAPNDSHSWTVEWEISAVE